MNGLFLEAWKHRYPVDSTIHLSNNRPQYSLTLFDQNAATALVMIL